MTEENSKLLKQLRTMHNGTYAKAIDDAITTSDESFIPWLTQKKYPGWKFSFCYEPGFDGLFITVTKDNISYKYMIDGAFPVSLKDIISDMVYSCNVLNAKYKKGEK